MSLADASPVLSYRFIDQTLQPGPPVSLKCSARGSPTPRISWTLNGFKLPKSERWVAFVIGQSTLLLKIGMTMLVTKFSLNR